jgi:hypothetical protein
MPGYLSFALNMKKPDRAQDRLNNEALEQLDAKHDG